jgi:SET domain-containing protein
LIIYYSIIEPTTQSEKQKLAIKQSNLFSKEKERQRNAIGRIEKIEVQYKGVPEDVTLLMNKHLSTPFECAKRQSQIYDILQNNLEHLLLN